MEHATLSSPTNSGKATLPPMISPACSPLLQRACACGGTPGPSGECEECRQKRQGTLQRAAIGSSLTGTAAPPIVQDVLRSSGQPLDTGTRAFMEPRFGHDFSRVRVHTDENAADSARAVHALAYTVGQNVVFAAGQYAPHTRAGRKLIAHELTHTIQQSHSRTSSLNFSRLEIDDTASLAEQESESIANTVMNTSLSRMPGATTITNSTEGSLALQRKISPKLPTIKTLLRARGFFEKDISEKDTHQVLEILKGLSDEDLRDTVRALDLEDHDYLERFLINIGESDKLNELEALRRIKNARVWRIETTTTDPKTKTKTQATTEVTGSCKPEQFQAVYQASMAALGWLDTAIGRLDAYIKSPNDSKNADVERALDLHFHSKADDVVKHIRARIAQIRKDMSGLKTMQIECHGVWDKGCDDSSAYVPGDNPELIVFCSKYFNNGAVWQAEAVIHEMAHTQVGGAHITDRAYQSDRLLVYLSTADALTNAESYGLLVQQLGTGKVVTSTAPKDTREDCPDPWWSLLQKAIALAERWNRNLQVTLGTLKPSELNPPSKSGTYLGGTTQGDINRAKKAVDRVANKLNTSIDFECEPEGGGRCDKAATYWYVTGDLHICPSWTNQKSEDARVESLLAGLYGYIGDVDDATRRSNYAQFARENQAGWASTPLAEVLGSKAWTPDDISVDITQEAPRLSQYIYTEDAKKHERVSNDLPVYQPSGTATSPLPYRVGVLFVVEPSGTPRPAPFTPPLVSAELEFIAAVGGFKKAYSDARPIYTRSSNILRTKIPTPFSFNFSHAGSFHMKFQLEDPDTKTTRIYDDTIQIKVT